MSSRGPVVTVMPKPCLKQAAHAQHVQKHAHFPPPSEEARRYSGIEYDRTPIVIAANELALPARGCPGRTFDDLDAHKYRHHLKKLRCPKELLGSRVAPSSYPARFGRLSFAADSGALPSLIHADTSESEEDEFRRPSEGETPSLLLPPASGSKRETDLSATGAEPKRLRKLAAAAHHSRASPSAESRSMHGRKHASTGEKTSNFASCPSSDSCLGGF